MRAHPHAAQSSRFSIFSTRILSALALLAALATSAHAQQYYSGTMWAWENVPTTSSGGFGNIVMTLDTTRHELSYYVEVFGLSATETATEIDFANTGFTGPMVAVLPLGSPKIGTLVTNPTMESELAATGLYVEVYTSAFPTGEIRGQINPSVPPPATSYCLGDGSATACPCGNASVVGNKEGCLNSLGTGGKLVASGFASVEFDSLELDASGMPNSTVLFFQGSQRVANGSGAVFGDGLRCAGGSVIRLGTETNSAGASHYPSNSQPRIALKGALPAGGNELRDYQCWYRNSASFCTAATYNLTNGLEVIWLP